MTSVAWQAFYFSGPHGHESPRWSEWIEASTESEAIAIARAHMGDCRHATLEPPRWGPHPRSVTVLRETDGAEQIYHS